MHTQNSQPNAAGHRQIQFNGPPPPRQPFIPTVNQRMVFHNGGGQNPTFFQPQLPQNIHYTQLQQGNPGINESSTTSPPTLASTPGLPPPPTNNGNPLQPGPAVFYSVPHQQQHQQVPPPPPPQRFIHPTPQQLVYVQIQQQSGGPRNRAPFGQRIPGAPMMQYQTLPNFNMNQPRFAVPFNPVMQQHSVEGQFFDPSLQHQQQQHQQQYQKNNYQGKNRRGGGGNSSQSSRRGSIRYDGRPDSANRPPSRPSPDSQQLPQFAEQNIPLQQGQIMQHNPMFPVGQLPPAMIPQQGQQYFIPQYTPDGQQIAQPVYLLQGDPSAAYHQSNQFYQYQMVVPHQQMQQQQHQQQLLMDSQQHQQQQHPLHFDGPPSHQQPSDVLNLGAIKQAIEELQQEKEKELLHNSPEKIESAAVPALDAVSVQSDADDYTPAGTPQSLNPLNPQQMDRLLDDINREIEDDKAKEEKFFEKDESGKQEFQRKRPQKPEQPHYQPPQRANAERKNSWRSTTSQQSVQLSKIAEEKPKATYPTAPPIVFEPSQPLSVPSDTTTPRASPTPPPKPKEVPPKSPDVPMIGGVPLIGGKPLVAGTVEKSASFNEHCAYCEHQGKPRNEITNHSLYSAKGFPSCPSLREDGCKVCGAKGDSAHLERFCKKSKVDKENIDFKNMANNLMDMTPNEKSGILIRDMGSHPTVREIQSYPNEEFQNGIEMGVKRIFVKQVIFRNNDQQNYMYEQSQLHQQQHYGQRYSNDFYEKPSYRGNRSGPRGGDRGGRGFAGQTYSGSRSRDGSRGSSSGGGGGRGRGSDGGDRNRGGSSGGYSGGERRSGGSNSNKYRT